jgi:hypothetical protein
MKEKIKALYQKLITTLSNFSSREKMLVFSGIGILLFIGVYQVADLVSEAFAVQRLALENADAELSSLPPLLINYTRLKTRRDEIEGKYKAIEIQEGALSLLEKLVKEKAQAAPGTFTINERTQAFGTQYQQRTFTIKFRITQVQNLVDFLKEVVSGSRPLLLTRVDVTKSFAGDRLDVEVDISSIEKKGLKEEKSGDEEG